jgi:hypothetical protein
MIFDYQQYYINTSRNTACCGDTEQEVGQEQGSAYTGMQKSVVIETASS